MSRKIEVNALKIGMYVEELDRPWIETPFLFQGFTIRTVEELAQLRQLCRHVFVLDNPPPGGAKKIVRPAPVIVKPAVEPTSVPTLEILKQFAPAQRREPRYRDHSSVEQEMPQARAVITETRSLVFNIMDDVRLGRAFDTQRAKGAVAGMVDSIVRNPDALVWLTQLKKKDEYTAMHSLRVSVLALAFGRHLDFSEEELRVLGVGALLHDLGKLKVPADILNKPGRLTPQEFETMKKHVPLGVDLLEHTAGIPRAAIEVARGHHERYDGRGYAMGLKGDNIGLFGSIGAIVDTYDALTSDRIYHDGMSAYDALNVLYSGRRRDYHPELVEQFIQCMGIYPIGAIVELNTGSIGVIISVNRERRLRPRVALVIDESNQLIDPAQVVDLMQPGPSGELLEIRKVLPSGSFGINPTKYLPLSA